MPTFPLPPESRRRFEPLFQACFSAVRIELTDRLPLPGIIALASGATIRLFRDAWRPGTPAGDGLLAHELAHLLQQAERPQAGEQPRLLVDPLLEAEANAWAWLAVHGGADRPRPFAHEVRPCSGVAQPWILMAKHEGMPDSPKHYGKKGYEPALRYGTTYFNKPDVNRGKPKDENFVQLTNFGITAKKVELAYRFLFDADPPLELFWLLRNWMGIAKGEVLPKDIKNEYEVRRQNFVRGEMRYYHTYGELAWALAQEVRTVESVFWERYVAIKVLKEPRIAELLALTAKRVAAFLMENQGAVEGFFDGKPAYGPLHGRKSYQEVVLSLVTPKGGVADTIGLLHDAKDLCGLGKLVDMQEKPFQLAIGENKTLTISKFDTRYNVGTVDEGDDWVIWMRSHNRAVWAGPSYTMINMWKVAAAAGASSLELAAMGWAMYAYWNAVYPHTSTPIHRFHETMAGAQEFGIPYLPNETVVKNWQLFIPGPKL
jgi:hypothetical protein